MMKITIKGDRAFVSLNKMKNATDQGIRRAFYFSGKELTKQANRLILDPPKTGRVYRIGNKRHQASAPGQAPANLSGVLRRSVDFNVKGSTELEFGAKADYAKYLEQGTQKMAARPYLLPAIYKQQRNMLAFFEKWIKTEVES